MNKLIWLFVAILLSGCAAGNKYDYRSSSITLPLKAADHRELVLSVEDARPYVVAGNKTPNFVGLQRGGFGNPFDVTTASGRPLTEDMSIAITRALTTSGYKVLTVNEKSDKSFLVKTATDQGATRIVTLKVNEWKSDIFMGITVHCDIELKIYDVNGELLAASDMKFDEEIGGAQIGASKNSRIVADEFAKRIGYLFNRSEVRSVL